MACLKNFLGLLHIANVCLGLPTETRDMIECMVAYTVSSAAHLLKKMRISVGIVSHHKKSGLDAQVIQDIKDVWCSFWNWAIVKGQIYRPLTLVHSP